MPEVSDNVNSSKWVLTEIDVRELQNMSTSKITFSVKLVEAIYQEEELTRRKINGCHGCLAPRPSYTTRS